MTECERAECDCGPYNVCEHMPDEIECECVVCSDWREEIDETPQRDLWTLSTAQVKCRAEQTGDAETVQATF